MRLATYSAGMCLGELALIGEESERGEVFADTEVICYALPIKSMHAFCENDATLKIRILENIASKLAKTVRLQNVKSLL